MARAMAIRVTITDPPTTVGMENIPRRGNQPSANSCAGSMLPRNRIASKIKDRTMPALMRTDTPDTATRTPLTAPSLRRRVGVPRKRLPLGADAVTLPASVRT